MNVGMDTAIEGVDAFIGILEVLLVILALAVTTSDSVSQAVRLYQWQSVVLAVVTSLSVITAAAANSGTASDPFSTLLLVLLVALLPAMLAFTIRPLLHRATLAKASQSIGDDLKMLFVAVIWPFFEKFTGLRTRLTLVQTDQPDATPGLRSALSARLALYQNLERDAEALWQGRQSIQTRTVAPVLFIGLLALWCSWRTLCRQNSSICPHEWGLR
ncbi:MAG: hypothetical protein IPK16_29230 [Anaerolineales bacterium]|nr:hypothetical protein [Anaerolineales bacterium]